MPAAPIRALLAACGTAVLLAGCGTTATPSLAPPAPAATEPVPVSSAGSLPPAKPAPRPARITYPANGSAAWTVVPAQGVRPSGGSGRLLRYRVAVEKDIAGLAPAAFARTADRILGDPQGWTAGGRWRFQRVGPGSRYDFTIYLATPVTRDALCNGSDGYTSCRNGDKVVINVARWVKGVPRYGASLDTYRAYLINHEVGHRLGNGHELCPGKGDLAPVMLQQTLGLHGCRANPWPYPDGELLRGRSGAYDEPIPPRDKGGE